VDHEQLSIGAVADRSGVAPSALRFYEDQGLIRSERNDSGHRRYGRDVLRRVAFIRVAQLVGLSLEHIRSALAELPDERTPNQEDWERLASSWTPLLDARIAMLERLRDRLTGCIGCGCLSMQHCQLMNPLDEAADRGPGARYVLDED
jgi:MerR family transcriptional regulator, redox-sensitive transcriptional activator SoxR